MIKINLTPEEELQNPLWYVPDLIMVVVVCAFGFFSAQYMLGIVEGDKKIVQAEIITVESRTAELDQDVKAYDAEMNRLRQIQEKLLGVGDLSSSKIQKFQPIIAVEHLQNLKPDGVWFSEFRFDGLKSEGENESYLDGGKIIISGHSLDNLIVAEFITALRATQTQDTDPSDFRTLVYFNKIDLKWTNLGSKSFGDKVKQEVVSFDLVLEYKARPLLRSETLSSFHKIKSIVGL